MKNWREKIEDIMSAAAFAEAGEPEIAKDILKSRKTVLLAISDRAFDRNALKYALNITQRIEANLEILYVTASDNERPGLKDFLSEVKNVGFRFSLVVKKDCMRKAILDYTEKRNEILFVIVGAMAELDIGCKGTKDSLSDTWKRLTCPLVVVSKAEMPLPA